MRSFTRQTIGDRPCWFFLVAAFLLFAQYAYIVRVGDFYPSISLPAGPGKIRDGETFSRNAWLVFALTSDGESLKVDEHDLLAPLPSGHRVPVVVNGFGLLPGSYASAAQQYDARAWLRTRLARQLAREDLVAIEVIYARYTPTAPQPRPYLPVKRFRVEL